jgi:hypothetical protein
LQQLTANVDEGSSCFRPNNIGHTADKDLPILTSLNVAFEQNPTKQDSFVGMKTEWEIK